MTDGRSARRPPLRGRVILGTSVGVANLQLVTRGQPPSGLIWSFKTQSLDHALQLVRHAEDLVGDNELLRGAAQWDEIFAWWAADCFALVNEADAAIDFIERAVEFGFINAPWLSKYEPFLASLRSEPRFGRLMDRVRRAWRAFEP